MPKTQKSVTSFIDRQSKKLKFEIEKQKDILHKSDKAIRAKQAELVKRCSKLIKQNEVREHFFKLANPATTGEIVKVIDKGITQEEGGVSDTNDQVSRGEVWQKEFVSNLTDLCRLISDARQSYAKKLKINNTKQDKLLDLEQKIDDFETSTLSQIKEITNENRRTVHVNASSGIDYLYTDTPFQCYQKQN